MNQKSERDPEQGSLRPPTRHRKSRWGFRGMTVRDWLPIVGALLIPVVIAAGTWGITWQQGKIEDRRTEADRKLAEQRAEDEALQAYLDQMNTLLLKHDLRNSKEDSGVRTLARARTLTVLDTLGSDGKRSVFRFLYEAKLLDSEKPVIDLAEANLAEADLSKMPIGNADLTGVNLSRTNLSQAKMIQVNLGCARSRAFLVAHKVSASGIERCVNLSRANLSDAALLNVNLSDANLSGANLQGADLTLAKLTDANLTNADLTRTVVTEEQLATCKSLKGATMPNGQKYEEWLKDKEGRK